MLKEIKYNARWLSTWLTGKTLGGFATRGAAVIGGPTTLIIGGLNTVLTIFLVQSDFKHEREVITDFYREEVAAKMHIRPEDVNIHDAMKLAAGNRYEGAEGNPTMAEAFRRNSVRRTLKLAVGLTVGFATLTAVTFLAAGPLLPAVLALTPFFASMGFTGAAAAASGAAGSAAAAVAVKIICGGIIGFTAGTVIGEVAERATGLSTPCAHEEIRRLNKTIKGGGKATPEQVMQIAVAAHPSLEAQIKQSYGKSYAALSGEEKKMAREEHGPRFNVEELTHAINSQIIKPQELAFAVVGQTSGVPPRAPVVPWKDRASAYAAHLNERGHEIWREHARPALTHARTKATHAVQTGLETAGETIHTVKETAEQTLHSAQAATKEKILEAKRSVANKFASIRSTEGVALSPEASAAHLEAVSALDDKWQNLVKARLEAPTLQAR